MVANEIVDRRAAMASLARQHSVVMVSRRTTTPQRSLPRSQSFIDLRSSFAASRRSVLAPEPDDEGLGSFVSMCVIANFISIGYIFLPWAFVQAGVVLSVIGLLVVSAQSYITATYVLESCARAEALADWAETNTKEANEKNIVIVEDSTSVTLDDSLNSLSDSSGRSVRQEQRQTSKVTFALEDPPGKSLEQSAMMDESGRSSVHKKIVLFEDPPGRRLPVPYGIAEESDDEASVEVEEEESTRHMIGNRRFELTELSRIFLGDRARLFFAFTTSIDIYGLTWSFAIVTASALQQNIPITDDFDMDYAIYILIFACVVIPLSCLPIVDQLFIQMIFLAGRVLMVLTMIATTAAAFNSDTPHFAPDLEDHVGEVKTADFSYLYIMLQIAVFSTAYQFSVPMMSEITDDRSKMASPIILGTCAWILVSTAVLSITLAFFFGDTIDPSSNLNWLHYHGGTGVFDDEGNLISQAGWSKFISNFVVCFPAFDLFAVFPLCAVGLGEILMGAWYGSEVHTMQKDWKRRSLFRIIASAPQIVGALFLQDIDILAKYAAIFTVLSYYVCPALLSIYSRKLLVSLDIPARTYYETVFSADHWAWGICSGAIGLICYVVVKSAME